MDKVRQFIKDYTRNCSNELCYEEGIGKLYEPWLTPDQAMAAVEIAREEVINKACEWLKSYRQDTSDGTGYIAGIVNDKAIEDFRKYIEGE